MVQIIHHGENIDKINDILAAAQIRFGMYGLEKTTMSEIAADLNMSKGSVYYYFPDKEALYKAVVEKEHNQFLNEALLNIEKIEEPTAMLNEYIRINLLYFRTLLNLSRIRLTEMVIPPQCMKEQIEEFRIKEVELIKTILDTGVKRKVFTIENTVEMANLFLDLLKGLRKVIIGKKEIFYLENEEFEVLTKKIYMFTEVFANGIKSKSE